MLSTNESLQINWTLGGVIAWVLFRNLEYAQAYSEEAKTAAYLAIYGAMPRNKGDERTPPQMSFKDACRSILRELEKGTLASTGTRRELMPREEIPARDWINNEFSFDPDKATILKEDSSFGRTSWGDLRFPVEQTLKLWSANESQATLEEMLSPTIPDKQNTYIEQGQLFLTQFEGRISTFKYRLGHKYIRYLLNHPYKETEYLDLYLIINPPPPSEKSHLDFDDDMGARVANRSIDTTTNETIGNYKAQIKNLKERLENAKLLGESEKADKLQDDINALTNEIAKSVDKNGRPRKSGGDLTKIRDSIRRAIDRTIDEISKTDKKLAEHLKTSILREGALIYRPSVETNWIINLPPKK